MYDYLLHNKGFVISKMNTQLRRTLRNCLKIIIVLKLLLTDTSIKRT